MAMSHFEAVQGLAEEGAPHRGAQWNTFPRTNGALCVTASRGGARRAPALETVETGHRHIFIG